MSDLIQKATFGGGCFWCTEALFQTVDGVLSVTSGYAGGTTEDPTYKEVCTGATGHAEVIQVEFDPESIDYSVLLQHFWKAHDPTTLNRQGADCGTQYRSTILYHDDTQRQIAEDSKRKAQSNFDSPITTEIRSLERFYPAEEGHQNYYRSNPGAPYCAMVIKPKLEKFR